MKNTLLLMSIIMLTLISYRSVAQNISTNPVLYKEKDKCYKKLLAKIKDAKGSLIHDYNKDSIGVFIMTNEEYGHRIDLTFATSPVGKELFSVYIRKAGDNIIAYYWKAPAGMKAEEVTKKVKAGIAYILKPVHNIPKKA